MRYCPKCREELVKSMIDSKVRLRCPGSACGFIYWNNPIPVVAIIVEMDNGIVLAHNKLAPPGIFSFITGFLEANESPETAAQRETFEELGLNCNETSFLGIFPFSKANQILIAYHILATGSIQLNEELDEVRIVQKEDLLGFTETGRFEIAEWLNRLQVLAG